jgi:heat shock protein HslJ
MKIQYFLFFLAALVSCKSSQSTESTAQLENTYWRLMEANGKPIVTPPNAREVHMVLGHSDGERRLQGFAGCNGLGGNYTTDGHKIKFTVITTKMYCEERLDVENFLTKALERADRYKIKGEELTLYEGSTVLASFQSVYLK